MIKKNKLSGFALAAFAITFIFVFIASTSFAGGPEPKPEGVDIKKGKIKGVLTLDFVPIGDGKGMIDIWLVGRCQKKEGVEDKIIDKELCNDCFSPVDTSEADFINQKADDLMTYVLKNIELPGCFRPDQIEGENEDLIITAASNLMLSEDPDEGLKKITAVVTIRALE